MTPNSALEIPVMSVLGRYLTYLILSYLLPVACVRKSYLPS